MSPTAALLPVVSPPLAQVHPLWIGLLVLAPVAFWFARRRRALPSWGLPATVVAIAAGIVFGFGIVEIPTIEDLPLQKWVEDIGSAVGAWAYLIVGVLAFAETGAFIGLIAPGETFVLLGGVLAGEGTLDYVTLLGIVWLMAFLGDLASFYLGRRLGRSFLERHGPRIKITPDRLVQVEQFFDKHGGKAVIIGRFIGFVRAIAPFLLGSGGVTARRFVPYSIVGSGLWSALFVTLGYVFWQSLDQVLAWAKQGAFAFGSVIAVVVAAFVVVHWLGEAENRERARGWLEQASTTRAGRIVLAVWRPLSGPAHFVWGRLTPGGLGLEVTTLVAVAAVGGFAYIGLDGILDDHSPTHTDRRLSGWVGDIRVGIVEDIAQVGLILGSPLVVGIASVVASLFLARRRHVWTAITLVVAAALVLFGNALAHADAGRLHPNGGLDLLTGSPPPSTVAGAAVIWVAIAVALTPSVRRIPGRIGLTGLAVILAALICCAPLVLREAYLSDVLASAGLAAAIAAVVALVALFVAHLRQYPQG